MNTNDLLTLEECAEDARLSKHILLAHINAGTLQALNFSVPTDKPRGRKLHYRIDPTEWARFKADSKTRAAAAPALEQPEPKRMGRPKAGTVKADGVLGDWSNRRLRKS